MRPVVEDPKSLYVANLKLRLKLLEKKVSAASERRRALPPGSSRARVTTANAKWSIACEARDRVLAELTNMGIAP